MKRFLSPVLLLALVFAAASTYVQAQDTQIGVTAAVNPEVTGFPPVADSRILRVGVNVVVDERIVTTANGQAQMLFLDESALTIGPNAEVVLDEYVYDPNRKTGKLVLSATKGLFRLVGGRISKNNVVVLKTPTATIGIRGGIVIVNVAPTGLTQATFLFGQVMQVTSGGVTKEVVRPGFTISAASADQPPSDPAPASAETLNIALGSLEGSGEAAADEGEQTPQDAQVAASGLDELGSELAPDDVAPTEVAAPVKDTGGTEVASDAEDESNTDEPPPAAETTPTTAPLTISGSFSGRAKHATTPANGTDDGSSTNDLTFSGVTVSEGTFTADFSSLGVFTSTIQSGGEFSITVPGSAQPLGTGTLSGTGFLTSDNQFFFTELTDQADNHKVLVFGGQATPASAFPTSGATFYALQNDFVLGSNIPFTRASNGGTLVPSVAESVADTAIYWDVSGSTTAQRPWAHLTMVISGQGPSQTSVFSAAGGQVLLDSSSRAFLRGGISGTSRLSSKGIVIDFNGELASADDSLGNDFFGTTSPDYFVLVGEKVNTSDAVLLRGVREFVPGSTTDITYFPNAIALKATDTLATRTSRSMFGYSGGAIQSFDSRGSLIATALFRNATGDPSDIDVFTSAETSKVQATIDVGNAFSANSLDAFGSSLDKLETDFGDHDVGAFASVLTSAGETADTVNTSGDSTFIDNFTFLAASESVDHTGAKSNRANFLGNGPAVINVELVMFTHFAAQLTGTNFIPSGVTLCNCEFLNWGFWGGTISRSGDLVERIHLANWVAGEIQPLSAISALSGTASYAGHVIGTVLSGSDVYQAVGGLAVSVNFDTTAVTGTVTDFDSGNFSVSGTGFSETNSRNTFSGTLSGSSGTAVGRSGSYLGSFMGPSSNANANMGGHFQVSGTDYKASGIFAATK